MFNHGFSSELLTAPRKDFEGGRFGYPAAHRADSKPKVADTLMESLDAAR